MSGRGLFILFVTAGSKRSNEVADAAISKTSSRGELEQFRRFPQLGLQRQNSHAHQVGAVDRARSFRDDGVDSEEALGPVWGHLRDDPDPLLLSAREI